MERLKIMKNPYNMNINIYINNKFLREYTKEEFAWLFGRL